MSWICPNGWKTRCVWTPNFYNRIMFTNPTKFFNGFNKVRNMFKNVIGLYIFNTIMNNVNIRMWNYIYAQKPFCLVLTTTQVNFHLYALFFD